MESRDHYVHIPPGAAALRVDLEVKHGALSIWLRNLDPTHDVPNRLPNPSWSALPAGKYTWVVAQPAAGTWGLSLTNDTVSREHDPEKVSVEEANYSLSFSTLNGSIDAKSDGQLISIHAQNEGAELGAPVVDVYPATLASKSGHFSNSGAPNIFSIDVPERSGVMRLHATAVEGASDLEAYLYDCTSGQCFYWDYAGTASREKTLIVHRPKAGKWMVAVNAAPVVVGRGEFVLEEIIGGAAVRHLLTSNAPWKTAVEAPLIADRNNAGRSAADSRILYCELVDAKLQDAESQRLAALATKDTPADKKGPEKPVAIASAIYEFHR
jgi:hypothetical protein